MIPLSVRLRNIWKLRAQIGTLAWFAYVIPRVFERALIASGLRKRINVSPRVLADYVGHFSFLRQQSFGVPLDKRNSIPHNSINWVIPDIGMGSGGHLNIFRLISNLERFGYACSIVINNDSQFATPAEAKDFLNKYYLPIKADVVIGQHNMRPAWFTFATSWHTAYTVRSFQSTRHKCYFVQDFEPWFYPPGSEFAFAEETYRFGFYGITAGGWLAEKLAFEYGMSTASMSFSYEADKYRPVPRLPSTERRVFFYARPSTPRRGFELGLLVLDAVAQRVPGFHAVIAGSDMGPYRINYPNTCVGIAKLEDLPEIYSRCDVALVLSFTNLSLLPLEIMACGCPVVSNTGPNVEWLLNSDNAVLVKPTVDALADAIVDLLTHEDKRAKLISRGLEFVSTTDWGHESAQVVNALKSVDRIGVDI
ncbi:glycosyltransferase family 4 protein [Paraburkholderia sediminicola]|uniref:glycosyltransferase family 4 protein n=1 Tax=Paraburkholderia sediminicola TaxID=458836 RepID=UPI0038BA1BF0